MRKTFLLICFWGMLQTLFAADTLFVREQQVPILIDRIDNVLYEMRIPARKGDVLNEILVARTGERHLYERRYVGISHPIYRFDPCAERGHHV